MRRIPWKPLRVLGFIFLAFFAGCGEKEPTIDELVERAESHLDAGRLENAIILLSEARERGEERVDVLEPLAFAYAAKGDPTLAALTFSRIAELVPEQPEYLLYAATSLLDAEDRKGAVARYREYLERRPDDRAIWVTLAEVQREAGRHGEALEAYLAAEKIQSRPEQQLAIGQLYLRAKNLAQAQAWFARAAEGGAEVRARALLGLLETAIRGGRFADAEKLVEQLDAEYPGRLEQSPLDSVRDQLADWRERQEAARRAAEAVAAGEAGESAEAGERSAAEGEEPTRGEEPLTETEPSTAETAAASSPPAQEPVAETAVREEASETEAEAEAPPAEAEAPPAETEAPPAETEAVAVAQPSPSGEAARRLTAARQAREAGNVQEAIGHYRRALVLDDSRGAVWAELSELYLATGQDRWAQATASEAVRRDPDNPRWVLQFLRAAQNSMAEDAFLRELEDAHRRFPDTPQITLVLARAWREAGNARNARLLFREFLEEAPADHPEREAAEDELQQLGP
ncbi:MAG: tetratricopeptide repeat protein [Verrucomicrobia bacterium]|jgi:tetratricopeptide (TPR) repeat protein|nr:tetratricopeptide repeat protein [Verrucomicrobiota bacterium]